MWCHVCLLSLCIFSENAVLDEPTSSAAWTRALHSSLGIILLTKVGLNSTSFTFTSIAFKQKQTHQMLTVSTALTYTPYGLKQSTEAPESGVSSDANWCQQFTLISSGYPLVTPFTWDVNMLCVSSFIFTIYYPNSCNVRIKSRFVFNFYLITLQRLHVHRKCRVCVTEWAPPGFLREKHWFLDYRRN